MREQLLWMMLTGVVAGRWIPPLALWVLARRKDGSAAGFSRCMNDCPLRFKGWTRDLCPACSRELNRLRWGMTLGLLSLTNVLGASVGDPWESWFRLLLVWVLCVLVLTDAWAMLIPNVVTVPALFLFAAVRAVLSPETFLSAVGAAAGVWGVCHLIQITGGGLGGGDGKLLALSATVIGWPHILFAFWLGSVCALLYLFLCRLAGKKGGLKEPLPFAPHLAAGVVTVMIWSSAVERWWSTWLTGGIS
ncbi:prepilin peptidase [Staphylospora marina]|uniref:prepilin peptidase n=1 Tax=Staphylospora marina TaxID=2490858 RepID=UPI000F5BC8AB|nr:prepilin peptidase [Staphylospora marina]